MSGAYCNGPFWDPTFWGEQPPVPTECFENTVLVFAPSVYVLFGGLIYSFCRRTWPDKRLPVTVIHLAKLLTSGAQMLVCSYGVYHALTSASTNVSDLVADILRTLNFLMVFMLQVRDRNRGIRSSAFLAVFWTLALIFELPIYYRHLLTAFGPMNSSVRPVENAEFIIRIISYPLIFLQFVLAAISENDPLMMGEEPIRNPIYTVSPVSKLLFSFFTGLVYTGYNRVLSMKDLPPLIDSMYSEYCYNRWKKVEESYKAKGENVGLIRSIFKAYWPVLISVWILESSFVVTRVSTFLALNELIIYLTSADEPSWKGYSYVLLILLAYNVSSTLIRWGDYILISLGIKIKSLLIAAIVRKSLRVDGTCLGKFTVGELVNLLSVDADKIYQFSNYVGIMIGCPLYVGLCTWMLWIFLGPSCLAGISIIIVMTPITAIVANLSRKVQSKQMNLKDSRLKYISEILSSIKIVKFYGWEPPFIDRVQNVRKEENGYLKTFAYLTATLRFFWSVTPFLVSLFAFVTYVLVNDLTRIDTNIAFVSLGLFNGMRFPLAVIPDVISNGVQTLVSVRRIQAFLQTKDLEENVVGTSPGDGNAARWKDVSSSWTGDEAELILDDIDLSVKTGELVAIVGKVGSGKSSMLSSLLGDIKLMRGKVDLAGTVAYVPQQAWIQNATIKQNIIFTKQYSKYLYKRVIDKCCLTADLKILPGGDQTEIGEKGVNLSGGQKQRVSLARAVYMDRDVYLLDDPLSAVDAHVGSAIFQDVIGNNGLLKGKTRIFVTNMLSVLPNVDRIVFLNGGKIVEQGTYEELRSTPGEFAEFLKEHANSSKQDVKPEPEPLVTTERRGSRSMSIVSNDSTLLHGEPVIYSLTSEEYMQSGTVKLSVYTKYLSKIGIIFCLLIALGFAGARSFDVYGGIWLSEWSSDSPEKTPENYAQRTIRILVYAALGLSYGVLSFIGTACLANGTLSAARKLHNDMLRSVIRAPMSFFDTTPLGRLLNRFGKDVDQLDITLPVAANVFLDMFFQLLGVIVLISINVPIFLVISAPLLVLYLVFQRIFMRTIRQIKRMEAVTRSPVYNHFAETLNGLSSIRAYRAEEHFISKSDVNVDMTQNCTYLLFVGKMWLGTRLDIIANFLIAISNILVVQQKGTMDPAVAGFIVSYSLGTAFAFNLIVHFASEVEAAIVASERIEEYSDIEAEPPWKTEFEPEESWPADGAVVFDKYSTRYRKGLDLVLKEVDLQIRPREKIGVVGRTGAGKSSLTLSLFRIIEAAEGRLMIDGINIAHLGLHDLRPRLTIIPQDPVIFSGTLRVNLDPNDVHSDEQLWNALEKAHIKKQFATDGLQTEIAEGGSNLSVGQRQLICLARAILQKKRILVMDEATAAVDVETDALIQKTIRADFSDCTILTIAHRLNTILDSDRVIVMDAGKVVEEGSPRALLEDPSSRFYDMALEAGLVETPKKS